MKKQQHILPNFPKESTFKKLLEIDSSTTTHGRNLWYLMTKIFNVKKGVSPSIMKVKPFLQF